MTVDDDMDNDDDMLKTMTRDETCLNFWSISSMMHEQGLSLLSCTGSITTKTNQAHTHTHTILLQVVQVQIYVC